MNSFKLSMPSSVIFGKDESSLLISEIRKYGSKVLVAIDESRSMSDIALESILKNISSENIKYEIIKLSEYNLDLVEQICEKYTSTNSDVLLAIGSKELINICKIVKYTASLKKSVLSELDEDAKEDVTFNFLPLIVIPTTSALECVLESVAVINDTIKDKLCCVEHLHFIPDGSIINPEYCFDCNLREIVYNSMYTLATLIEIYVSEDATLISDLLAIEGIKNIVLCIDYMMRNNELSYEIKEGLCYASLLAGMASHNVSAGVIKGMAFALKNKTNASIEQLTSMILYQCVLKNMQRVQFYDKHEDVIDKYAKIGSLLSEIDYSYEKKDILMRAISEYLDGLNKQFKIEKLSDLGITSDDLYNIASNIDLYSNPVKFADSELIEILEKCL